MSQMETITPNRVSSVSSIGSNFVQSASTRVYRPMTDSGSVVRGKTRPPDEGKGYVNYLTERRLKRRQREERKKKRKNSEPSTNVDAAIADTVPTDTISHIVEESSSLKSVPTGEDAISNIVEESSSLKSVPTGEDAISNIVEESSSVKEPFTDSGEAERNAEVSSKNLDPLENSEPNAIFEFEDEGRGSRNDSTDNKSEDVSSTMTVKDSQHLDNEFMDNLADEQPESGSLADSGTGSFIEEISSPLNNHLQNAESNNETSQPNANEITENKVFNAANEKYSKDDSSDDDSDFNDIYKNLNNEVHNSVKPQGEIIIQATDPTESTQNEEQSNFLIENNDLSDNAKTSGNEVFGHEEGTNNAETTNETDLTTLDKEEMEIAETAIETNLATLDKEGVVNTESEIETILDKEEMEDGETTIESNLTILDKEEMEDGETPIKSNLTTLDKEGVENAEIAIETNIEKDATDEELYLESYDKKEEKCVTEFLSESHADLHMRRPKGPPKRDLVPRSAPNKSRTEIDVEGAEVWVPEEDKIYVYSSGPRIVQMKNGTSRRVTSISYWDDDPNSSFRLKLRLVEKYFSE